MPELHDNSARSRYEMAVEGGTAFVAYRHEGELIVLEHAEVPASVGGRGVGSVLVGAVLDDVRRRGLKFIPECGFIRRFVRLHPDYADLLAT